MIAEVVSLVVSPSFELVLSTILLVADEAGNPEELSFFQQLLANPFLPIIILVFLGFQIFVAPERRRQMEEAKMLASLKKNDRIVTSSGIHGTVVSISDEAKIVTVRIDDNNNTRIRINSNAIARVIQDAKEKTSESESKDAESSTKS